MKILHVGTDSVHVTRFINAFENVALTHFLLSDLPNHEVKVQEQFVLDVRSINPLKFFGYFAIVRRVIDQVQPTVIHVHQVNRMAYIVTKLAQKMGIPVVTTAWGSDVLIMPKKNRLYSFMVRQTISRSIFVTADAQNMITAMQSMVNTPSKYVWLQYGIEPIQGVEKAPIIYSNRLHKPLYRISTIINYFAAFHEKHPEWQLHIGASGSETPHLKKLVEDLKLENHVVFLGWLDEALNRSMYEKSSMFVSIPSSDGTSVSLLEAMSAGCIPVVSDLPANKEWIENGKNGIVEVQGQNPFESALLLVAADAQKENLELIEQKATRKAAIANFEALYLKAINGK
jgi:glycosyltransferase involved in cell wall biosynthesis